MNGSSSRSISISSITNDGDRVCNAIVDTVCDNTVECELCTNKFCTGYVWMLLRYLSFVVVSIFFGHFSYSCLFFSFSSCFVLLYVFLLIARLCMYFCTIIIILLLLMARSWHSYRCWKKLYSTFCFAPLGIINSMRMRRAFIEIHNWQ